MNVDCFLYWTFAIYMVICSIFKTFNIQNEKSLFLPSQCDYIGHQLNGGLAQLRNQLIDVIIPRTDTRAMGTPQPVISGYSLYNYYVVISTWNPRRRRGSHVKFSSVPAGIFLINSDSCPDHTASSDTNPVKIKKNS